MVVKRLKTYLVFDLVNHVNYTGGLIKTDYIPLKKSESLAPSNFKGTLYSVLIKTKQTIKKWQFSTFLLQGNDIVDICGFSSFYFIIFNLFKCRDGIRFRFLLFRTFSIMINFTYL